jgi:hypothetical protein
MINSSKGEELALRVLGRVCFRGSFEFDFLLFFWLAAFLTIYWVCGFSFF